MNIGIKIKALRKEHNLTQVKLAKILGVGKTTVSNYETGYSCPDAPTIKALADYFNVPIDYLLGRTDTLANEKLINVTDTLTDEEKKILFIYRQLSDRYKGKAEARLEQLLEEQTAEVTEKHLTTTIDVS